MFRVRPGKDAYIEGSSEQPYEIHLVSFNSEEDFENFKNDDERKKFLHLKEQSIRTSIMIRGQKL